MLCATSNHLMEVGCKHKKTFSKKSIENPWEAMKSILFFLFRRPALKMFFMVFHFIFITWANGKELLFFSVILGRIFRISAPAFNNWKWSCRINSIKRESISPSMGDWSYNQLSSHFWSTILHNVGAEPLFFCFNFLLSSLETSSSESSKYEFGGMYLQGSGSTYFFKLFIKCNSKK